MWVKKLNLKNFQKHENLTLDFQPGVNILYGSSDAGKSCIRRAIGFVFFGDPCSDDIIRKEETKTTSVTVLLDNDVEVERIKSASINRYNVRVPGQKEQTWDSIGKDIPEDVQKYLQVNQLEIDKYKINLNISEQITLPFLSDISGSARLKLFNRLTGVDTLDLLRQNFNKELVGINKDLKIQQNIVTINQPQFDKLSKEIERGQKIRQIVEDKKKFAEEIYQKLLKLKELQLNIVAKRMAIKVTNSNLTALKIGDEAVITSLKVKSAFFTLLNDLKQRIFTCADQLSVVQADLGRIKAPGLDSAVIRGKIERLSKLLRYLEKQTVTKVNMAEVKRDFGLIKEPKINCAEIKTRILRMENLTGIAANHSINLIKLGDVIKEISNISTLIPTQEEEWKGIFKEAGLCPTCKQPMDEEHLKKVHL